jgi:hypothetical protein
LEATSWEHIGCDLSMQHERHKGDHPFDEQSNRGFGYFLQNQMDKQYDIAYDYFFFLCILSPFIFICC